MIRIGLKSKKVNDLIKRYKGDSVFSLPLESKVKQQWPVSQEGNFYKKPNSAGTLALDMSTLHTVRNGMSAV